MRANFKINEDFYHSFQQLAENSQDVFWIKDAQFLNFIYVNAAYEHVWGDTSEHLLKDPANWRDCVYAEDMPVLDEMTAYFRSPQKKHEKRLIKYRLVNKKLGGVHFIEETVYPIFNKQQQLIGFAGITKDITASSDRIAELNEATYFFKLFAEKMRAVFWVRDESCNRQIYLSPGYEKIWRRSRRHLYEDANTWLDTVYSEDKELASNTMRFRVLDEHGLGVHYENRYRIVLPDNTLRWIKDTSFPIENDKDEFIGFAGIAEDITKEVEYEAALREAKEKAELANKAKSDFLAMISHELRTPLNAIMGMSQILLAREISSDMKENITLINEAGKNLLSLVGDVLDFARLEAGKLSFVAEPFDLIELFQHTLDAMTYFIKDKDLYLTLNVAPGLNGKVVGDPNRVRQVLTNLLSNAIKFTDKGGVTVNLRGAVDESENMCFDVVVQDTGVGIPIDKLNMIFDKFSQVDAVYQRRHGGIGLGLSITKELVEVMQGSIDVTSELGKGSCFHFTLTLPLQTVKEQEDNAWREAMLHGDKRPQFHKRILLVEDNLINQRIARMMLEDFGCQLDVLNGGQEVLSHLDSMKEYDLIFLDVGLPDMNGFEISARLREQPELTKIPIVAMTAHVLESDRAHAAASGMDAVLGKPISYDEVRKVLTRYL